MSNKYIKYLNDWINSFKRKLSDDDYYKSESLFILNREFFTNPGKKDNYNKSITKNYLDKYIIDEEKYFYILNEETWKKIKLDNPKEIELKVNGVFDFLKYYFKINEYIYYFYFINEDNKIKECFFRFNENGEFINEIITEFINLEINDFFNKMKIKDNLDIQTIYYKGKNFLFKIKGELYKNNDFNNININNKKNINYNINNINKNNNNNEINNNNINNDINNNLHKNHIHHRHNSNNNLNMINKNNIDILINIENNFNIKKNNIFNDINKKQFNDFNNKFEKPNILININNISKNNNKIEKSKKKIDINKNNNLFNNINNDQNNIINENLIDNNNNFEQIDILNQKKILEQFEILNKIKKKDVNNNNINIK